MKWLMILVILYVIRQYRKGKKTMALLDAIASVINEVKSATEALAARVVILEQKLANAPSQADVDTAAAQLASVRDQINAIAPDAPPPAA